MLGKTFLEKSYFDWWLNTSLQKQENPEGDESLPNLLDFKPKVY